jgi:hypothetical protein
MEGRARANRALASYPPGCPIFVMPALVAGIHVSFSLTVKKTWMAGT